MNGFEIKMVPQRESMLFYSHDKQRDVECGCIGHLRADYGSKGEEFWTTWWDHCEDLKTQAFKDELDAVINHLRKKGNMLNSLRALSQYCYKRPDARLDINRHDTYGFKIDTEAHSFYLRCMLMQGDNNLYCYCYVRDKLERSLAAAQPKKED